MKRVVLVVTLAVWACGLVLAGEVQKVKPPKEGVGEKAPTELKKGKLAIEKAPDDEATRKVKEILKTKKVTFDFVDTPAADALAFMQALLGVNVVVAPEVDRKQPLTLRVNDMNAGSALQWLARLVGAKMEIKEGAVFIGGAGEPAKGKYVNPKIGAPDKKFAVKKGHAPGLIVAKAQLKLGDIGAVELYFYDDDLDPETRELFRHLLRRRFIQEIKALGGGEEMEEREAAVREKLRRLREKGEGKKEGKAPAKPEGGQF